MSETVRLLYEKHSAELNTFARRRVGKEESLDVVHDAYLRLISYSDETTLENPRAYLYRVTSNVAFDHGTRTRVRAEWTEPDLDLDTIHATHPAPDAVINAREKLQMCLDALAELPEIYRHIFLLHRVDGMSQGDVATALGIPKRTVERYIAKALAHCLERVQA
ncbi:RNA polymerase sigma factor [Dechloromonas sp.]|uniref:RNA polymerase sigma factor n=1 Tax=Dechloromonas sp. TaxID=1917218 RepID=UPI001203E5A3|nr:sigma-70 family RNA polymerase sigma factor [Dechloromonas sp.]MBU3697480.1 sigma-70 family RNA polymerase sigma factor [Dechloromonas sp.]TEX44589.1 MAG: RNA polymerase subunit sigma-24 [Rhodocyclaceae bacterium]